MPVNRLQSLVATGQYLAAYREVERLAMDPYLDPSLRAKVFTIGVRAAAGLRELYAAAKMAEKAIESAELGSNWEDIGNARLHTAIIYLELGDTTQALRFFRLFFEYLDRYPSLRERAAIAYYNQALTHQQRREYAEALESYRLAIEDFERTGHRPSVLASHQNSLWVHLLQGNLEAAETSLATSQSLCAELEVPAYQATQLYLEAYHARLCGQYDRAVALCEELFQSGRPGVEDRHLACAAWIMAGVTLETSHLHEAAIFADLAIRHALQAKQPQLMNLASEIRRQVHVKKNALA